MAEPVPLMEGSIALAPHRAVFHANLGNVRFARSEFDAADACFRQAHALAPDDAAILFNLARLLDDLGRPAEEMDVYRLSPTPDPGMAEAPNHLCTPPDAGGRSAWAGKAQH